MFYIPRLIQSLSREQGRKTWDIFLWCFYYQKLEGYIVYRHFICLISKIEHPPSFTFQQTNTYSVLNRFHFWKCQKLEKENDKRKPIYCFIFISFIFVFSVCSGYKILNNSELKNISFSFIHIHNFSSENLQSCIMQSPKVKIYFAHPFFAYDIIK